MNSSNYIRSLLNDNVKNKEDVIFCDYATELDDMAYVIFINYIHSEDFISKFVTELGSNISFQIPTQEHIIQQHLEKSNNGIEITYDFAKGYLRKIKLNLLNNSNEIE